MKAQGLFREGGEGVSELLRSRQTMPRPNVSKDDLANLGRILFPHTYALEDNDRRAFDLLIDFAEAESPLLAMALKFSDEQIIAFGAARWADCGFPEIIVGHRYAAALCATSIPEEVHGAINPPWPTFILELPVGMFPIVLEGNIERDLRRVLVQRIEHTWQWIAFPGEGPMLWAHGMTTTEMIEEGVNEDDTGPAALGFLPVESIDANTSKLIGRLIANVCLAMSDAGNVKSSDKTFQTHRSYGKGRRSKEPTCRIFRVGKPITFDCRQAVDDFIHGRRSKSPTVQVLVRGHWKMQPHGPGNALRKLIWREPYWRGNEDAPILVRSLRMEDK